MPLVAPPKVEWPAIERSLGYTLPQDYKEWASEYSSMRIAKWLFVKNAAIEFSLFGRVAGGEVLSGVRNVIARKSPDTVLTSYDMVTPFPLRAGELRFDPEPYALLPWGFSEMGEFFGWVTGPDPQAWTIFVTDGGGWWHFDGGFSDFLLGVMTKQVACPYVEIEPEEEVMIEEMYYPKWHNDEGYSADFTQARVIRDR